MTTILPISTVEDKLNEFNTRKKTLKAIADENQSFDKKAIALKRSLYNKAIEYIKSVSINAPQLRVPAPPPIPQVIAFPKLPPLPFGFIIPELPTPPLTNDGGKYMMGVTEATARSAATAIKQKATSIATKIAAAATFPPTGIPVAAVLTVAETLADQIIQKIISSINLPSVDIIASMTDPNGFFSELSGDVAIAMAQVEAAGAAAEEAVIAATAAYVAQKLAMDTATATAQTTGEVAQIAGEAAQIAGQAAQIAGEAAQTTADTAQASSASATAVAQQALLIAAEAMALAGAPPLPPGVTPTPLPPGPTPTPLPPGVDDPRFVYGMMWSNGTYADNAKYAKQMGYKHIAVDIWDLAGWRVLPDASGMRFYLNDCQHYAHPLNIGSEMNLDNPSAAGTQANVESRMVWKNTSIYPNNIAPGWYFTNRRFMIHADFQQQRVIDEVVAKVIAQCVSGENPAIDFKWAGFAWDVPLLTGDFWSGLATNPDGTSAGGQQIILPGDTSVLHAGISHEYKTYSDGTAAFMKKLFADAAARFGKPTRVWYEPFRIYEDLIRPFEARSDKALLIPRETLITAEATSTVFATDTRNYASGILTKDMAGSSAPNDGSETGTRAIAATAAMQKGWYNFYGRYNPTSTTVGERTTWMGPMVTINQIVPRAKLVHVIPGWDNLVNVPLTSRTWNGTVYTSTNSYMSPDVYYSRHPYTKKVFAVFNTAAGIVNLRAGESVVSIKRTDNLFIETTDAGTDVVVSGTTIKPNAVAVGKGYIITTSQPAPITSPAPTPTTSSAPTTSPAPTASPVPPVSPGPPPPVGAYPHQPAGYIPIFEHRFGGHPSQGTESGQVHMYHGLPDVERRHEGNDESAVIGSVYHGPMNREGRQIKVPVDPNVYPQTLIPSNPPRYFAYADTVARIIATTDSNAKPAGIPHNGKALRGIYPKEHEGGNATGFIWYAWDTTDVSLATEMREIYTSFHMRIDTDRANYRRLDGTLDPVNGLPTNHNSYSNVQKLGGYLGYAQKTGVDGYTGVPNQGIFMFYGGYKGSAPQWPAGSGLPAQLSTKPFKFGFYTQGAVEGNRNMGENVAGINPEGSLSLGMWHKIECQFILNDVDLVHGTTTNNGIFRAWVDGIRVCEWSGITWRDHKLFMPTDTAMTTEMPLGTPGALPRRSHGFHMWHYVPVFGGGGNQKMQADYTDFGHAFIGGIPLSSALTSAPPAPTASPVPVPPTPVPPTPVPPPPVQGTLPPLPAGKTSWKLVFNDEFNGTTLDTTKWINPCYGADRIRRTEAGIIGWWKGADSYLDGQGNLVLRTRYDPATGQYSSGAIHTRRKFEHTFGYYEARIHLSALKKPGHWAGWWLYNDNPETIVGSGRDSTEIDIVEKPWPISAPDKISHALHWDKYPTTAATSAAKTPTIPGVGTGFHTYGVVWTPTIYIFYVDGVETWRTTAGGVCQVPLYLKLTDEIGSWPDGIVSPATLPDYTYVDYVRVYDYV